jgi:tripartite ATP-independent transporter DctM subunit
MRAMVGRIRGGLAMAAIAACAGFGAVCGSSLATASTMGRVALPELRHARYSARLATGTLAAGGTLGILIPPSVALIVYAIVVETSIIEMFQAALIPGLIAVAFFLTAIAVLVRVYPDLAPLEAPMERQERREALRRLAPILGIFLAIILGLGAGLFTPTPAAGVGVAAIAIYGLFRRGERALTWPRLGVALRETAVTAGMISFILFGAEVLKSFFSRSGLPASLADWAATSGLDPWIVLIVMLLILILLGCFMDSLAMILVIVPFFWPALLELNGGDWATADSAAYGMSSDDLKIWFGILALVVVELGLITPPVGLNVFIISALARDVPISETFKGVIPFFSVEIVRVALLIALPALSLWLPHYLSS